MKKQQQYLFDFKEAIGKTTRNFRRKGMPNLIPKKGA